MVISAIAAGILTLPLLPLKREDRLIKSLTSSVINGTYDRNASVVRPNLTNYPKYVSAIFENDKGIIMFKPNLFLLHQLDIGTIVHNVRPKYRRSKTSINLFRADVLQLS